MPRSLSSWRFLLAYGFFCLLLVLAAAALFHLLPAWSASLLYAALLFALVFLYQRNMRRHIRKLASEAGLDSLLPLPGPGEALEDWTRQYVATATRKLAEERGLLDSLFDILQDAILFIDGENRILRANAAAALMLGRKSESLIGAALASAANQEALGELANKIRTTGAYQAAEIYLPSIPGPGHIAGIPLRTTHGACCAHLMLVMRDLTRIRRLESAGEEYATNISHELKTPLTLVLGYTETLLSHGETDPEFQKRSLLTIERHTKRIIRIIDDLLRLAWLRNEAGTVGISRTPIPIANLVDQAISHCRDWGRAAGIEIEPSVPAGLVWPLNGGLIEEAIVNLVKNAILYALGGPIEIRVRVLENGRLEIAVADRGPGLKPEDAKHIFDRFYRADKGRSRALGGSGLGLPIVQQIVEAHQGTARIETAPGEGCTFLLEIPPRPDGA